jgi:hypothetical protein
MFVVVAVLSAALTSWSPPATAIRSGSDFDTTNTDTTNTDTANEFPSLTDVLPTTPSDELAASPVIVDVTFNGGATGTLEHDAATERWTLIMAAPLGTDRVELNAANPQAGIDGFAVTLSGDGTTFTGDGALPIEGVWQTELTFLADRFDLQSANTTIETGVSS